MSLILILFLMGVIFIIIGYTKNLMPTCREGVDLKIVNKEKFNLIPDSNSTNHMGSYLN